MSYNKMPNGKFEKTCQFSLKELDLGSDSHSETLFFVMIKIFLLLTLYIVSVNKLIAMKRLQQVKVHYVADSEPQKL